MADGCNMKSVFSCSDFLSDMWQGGSNAADTLDPLCLGGSTHLGRGTSTDLLNLIGQSEITDSHSRVTRSLAASSSNKDSSGGQLFMEEPVESNLLNSSMSHHHMLPEPFFLQQASTSFPQYDQHPTQLQTHSSNCGEHGGFHMDPVKQAKAICNHGMNATALQQQLADLKSRTSGLESFINFGMHGGASMSSLETGPAKHHTAGTLDSMVPQVPLPATIPTPASAPQPQLSLQQSQLRQLASVLGSANMAALQNMTLPTAAAPSAPDTTGRGLSEQVSGGGKCLEHSSGDDDTGAIPELHKLTGAGDSFGDEEEHEHAWEAKLDGSQLPPPEMKRMRRMLSNRESARRSRRRKQAHMQDLEVQNNKLVEANQKLQKELSSLRTVAKEAILEKKRSQAALEILKHKVVHLLGEHDMVPKQDPAKKQKTAGQEAPMPTSTGTDSDVSGSGHLAVKEPVKSVGSLEGWPSSPALEGELNICKDTPAQMSTDAAASPKSGSKRKASDRGQSLDSGVKRRVLEL